VAFVGRAEIGLILPVQTEGDEASRQFAVLSADKRSSVELDAVNGGVYYIELSLSNPQKAGWEGLVGRREA